jgi:hypothetical protein
MSLENTSIEVQRRKSESSYCTKLSEQLTISLLAAGEQGDEGVEDLLDGVARARRALVGGALGAGVDSIRIVACGCKGAMSARNAS